MATTITKNEQTITANQSATDHKISGKKVRSSNFELLRIVCMFMIIAYHYCVHGNHNTIFKSKICLNQVISVVFGSWGLLGVDCFIFISAYFLLNSHHFKIKKVIKLVLQTMFYSTVIALLLYCTNLEDISKKAMIRSFFSPVYNQYWFVTAYCLLFAIFPFLNKIVHSMSSNYLLRFLIILTILIPFYRTLTTKAPIDAFLFFIYLYLVMGYLKHNPGNWFEQHAKIGFLITTVTIVTYQILVSFLGTEYNLHILIKHANKLATRYSPFMVLDAIFLFYIFKNLKIKNSKFINTLASTTLGIYLIHENPLLRKLLWDKFLKVKVVYYYPTYILYFFFSVFSIFVIAAVIDLLRIYLFEKPLFNLKINWLRIQFRKIDSFVNGEKK